MVKRPSNLKRVVVELKFNDQLYTELEVDLEHINRGKELKSLRSSFTLATTTKIISFALEGIFLEPVNTSEFANTICEYYVKIFVWKGQKMRIVFCICNDEPATIGIITLFREKKSGI